MKRIINLGRKVEDREYRFTCKMCDTVFEAHFTDGKRVYRGTSHLLVTCPLCETNCYCDTDDYVGKLESRKE